MGASADQFNVPECPSSLVLFGVAWSQSVPDSLQMLTTCIWKIKCRDFKKYDCFSLEASLISSSDWSSCRRKLHLENRVLEKLLTWACLIEVFFCFCSVLNHFLFRDSQELSGVPGLQLESAAVLTSWKHRGVGCSHRPRVEVHPSDWGTKIPLKEWLTPDRFSRTRAHLGILCSLSKFINPKSLPEIRLSDSEIARGVVILVYNTWLFFLIIVVFTRLDIQ